MWEESMNMKQRFSQAHVMCLSIEIILTSYKMLWYFPNTSPHLNSSRTLGPTKLTVLASEPQSVVMRALEVEVPEYRAM